MATVGYGDINAGTDTERVFAICALLVGASVFGFVVGSVSLMLEQLDAQRAAYREKLDSLKDFSVRPPPAPGGPLPPCAAADECAGCRGLLCSGTGPFRA